MRPAGVEAHDDSASKPAVRRRINEDAPTTVTHRGERGREAVLESDLCTMILGRGNFHGICDF